MRQRSECLPEDLERLLQNTHGPTPPRNRNFCLLRVNPGAAARGGEAR